mmetsp:Transcript_22917/g.52530  ORF Transcript_22917/g.52530 Transcript_22917/m.52530 type:complete len:1224 (+) Transcript_22917:89-3760(+)
MGGPDAWPARRMRGDWKPSDENDGGSTTHQQRTTSCTTALFLVVAPLALMSLGALLWRRHHPGGEPAHEMPRSTEVAASASDSGLDTRQSGETQVVSFKDFQSWQALSEVPLNDARHYETAVLRNGLRVLSIQDNRSLSSAFALAVEAGSYDDPYELPGLMHFCEHMLFLGTEKYPEPEGFDDFVNMHGGNQNAYTAAEVTNYHVQLDASAAQEGLDRFAEFFRAPLFDQQYAQKEVHAIDSEHAKNVESASGRIYAVMMSLASPSSPVSRFHTGNVDTLPTEAGAAGNHTFTMLRQRFEELYCPPKMRLVMFGPNDPGSQLRDAARTFGTIPEGHASCTRQSRPSHASPKAWPLERLARWVDIQGTTPHALLWLTFPLPDLSAAYASQPLDYILWSLNYAGTQSMFQVLRDSTGLAYSVSVDTDANSAGTMVIVTFGLTEAGRNRPDLVIEVFYAYLAMLRIQGINEDLQASLEKSSQRSWDWAEPTEPLDTVMGFAEQLAHVKATDVLWASSLTRHRDEELMKKVLDLLQPSNMNVGFTDPRTVTETSRFSLGKKDAEERTLPYFGVKYAIRSVAEVVPGATSRWNGWLSKLAKKESVLAELRAKLMEGGVRLDGDDSLRPPPMLQELTANVGLKHAHARLPQDTLDEVLYGAAPENSATVATLTQGIASTSELWYREGWTSNMPKNSPMVSLNVLLRLIAPPSAPEVPAIDVIRLSLYSRMLREEIDPQLEDLSDAGASYSVGVSESGMHFSFTGFEPVVHALVPQVLQELHDHQRLQTVSKRFNRIVEMYRQELKSYTSMPVSYAVADRGLLLTKGMYSRAELLNALDGIHESSAASALEEVLLPKPFHMIALAMGNIDVKQAGKSIAAIAQEIRRPDGMEVSSEGGDVHRTTPIVDPSRPVELRVVNPRPGDQNHVLVMSFLHGISTIPSRALLGLLGQILGQVSFDVLRTSMQLGYVVEGGDVMTSNVQMMSVVVQGNKDNADKVESAVHRVLFLDMPKKLDELTDDAFQAYKDSFLDALVQKPYHTGDEVAHFWTPISTGSNCFDMRDKMMKYMNQSLTSKELLKTTWQRLMMPTSGSRKRVMIKYFPEQVPNRPSLEQMEEDLNSHGVPRPMQELLRREYTDTLILDTADSKSRETLLRQSQYFPTTWSCSMSDARLEGLADKNSTSAASSLISVDEEADVGTHARSELSLTKRSRWLRQGGFALQPGGFALGSS